MSFHKVALLFVLGIFLGMSEEDEDGPFVKTRLGSARGKWETSKSGRKFAVFHRLPYAKPPLGKLRLKAPEPVEPWNVTIDCSEENPVCIQTTTLMKIPSYGVRGQEDCLYLTISTHQPSGSHPVLINFHAGMWVWGSAQTNNAAYLMDEDVVVVNVNYRVGILGFLTFETEDLRGNQGLKDQAMAIRWVNENIAAFGGDPNLVTLIGESSGAASVHFHIASRMSKGLFHRGIMESGSLLSPWALQVPGAMRKKAEKLMKLIDCPVTPKEGLDCIMEKDAKEVTQTFYEFLEWDFDPLGVFGPVSELPGPEAFLSGPIESWLHNPLPILISMDSAEGLVRTLLFILNGEDLKWLSDTFNDKMAMSLLYFESARDPEEVTKKLREYYLPKQEITLGDWVNLTTLYTDAWFTTSIIEAANQHNGDVYFYYMDLPPKRVFYPKYMEESKLIFGSPHEHEIDFIWDRRTLFPESGHNQEEAAMSKKFVKLVVDFAKNGNPGVVDGQTWKKWTESDQNYMLVGNDGFNLKKDLLKERYNFWKSLDYRSKYNWK